MLLSYRGSIISKIAFFVLTVGRRAHSLVQYTIVTETPPSRINPERFVQLEGLEDLKAL